MRLVILDQRGPRSECVWITSYVLVSESGVYVREANPTDADENENGKIARNNPCGIVATFR